MPDMTGRKGVVSHSAWVCCGLFLYTVLVFAKDDCREWHGARQTQQGTLLHRCVDGSPIDEVVIDTRFQTSPARLLALVNDYDAFEEFIPDVADSRVLQKAGQVQWVYHHLHFPGPVADRVYILRSTVLALGAQRWRVSWALSDREFPGFRLGEGIRPKQLSGFWEIEAGDPPGVTRARYAVHHDPGGLMPAWLVMPVTDRYVQQVVEAVRGRLEGQDK